MMIKPELKLASVGQVRQADWDDLFSTMNRYGCVHIRQTLEMTGPVESLRQLGSRFGAPIFHKLSDEFGIHPIRYIPGYPEYANANVEDLDLHTDGSFEQTPPSFMLMYCERPAEEGGHSTLASGDRLFHHLRTERPDHLSALSKPAVFTITRDDRRAQRSVFTTVDGRVRVAYRSGKDIRLDIDPEAVDAFGYVGEWLRQPSNYVTFRLGRGDILIFDNTRMLHGRSAFSRESARSLYGLWCDGRSEHRDRLSWGIDPRETD
jgi:alpha-ketoglutarate-dependent taurine dioxygenase